MAGGVVVLWLAAASSPPLCSLVGERVVAGWEEEVLSSCCCLLVATPPTSSSASAMVANNSMVRLIKETAFRKWGRCEGCKAVLTRRPPSNVTHVAQRCLSGRTSRKAHTAHSRPLPPLLNRGDTIVGCATGSLPSQAPKLEGGGRSPYLVSNVPLAPI